jgi:site-specific DNA recombinase
MSKRCVIYTRVSSEVQQEHGTSLRSQYERCAAFAGQNGYEIMAHANEGVGDSMSLDRAALQRALDMVRTQQADVLLCDDLDRLSRDVADQWDIKRQVERAGGELRLVQLPAEDSDSYLILFAMQGVVGQIEKRAIIKRTSLGKYTASKEGRVLGSRHHPYGYRYLKGEGRFEPVEDELMWVRRMYEWFVHERATLTEIARRLDEAGVPTKRGVRSWSFSTVHDILLNELYSTGQWYWRKTDQRNRRSPGYKGRKMRPREEWVAICLTPPGEEPPVPVEMAELVRAQLDRNKHMAAAHPKRDYTLRGLVFCADCGYRMVGKVKHTRTAYVCNCRYNLQRQLPLEQRCPNVGNFYTDEIDELVWQAVVRVVSDEELIRATLERVTQESGADAPAENTSALEKQAREFARRLENLYDLAEGGDIPRDVFRERKAKIDEKLAATQTALRAVAARKAEQERAREAVVEVIELCRQVREGLPLIPPEERREFYMAIGLRVIAGATNIRVEGLLGSTHTQLIPLPSRTLGAQLSVPTRGTVKLGPHLAVRYPFDLAVPLDRPRSRSTVGTPA